jgi:ribosomal protein S8E
MPLEDEKRRDKRISLKRRRPLEMQIMEKKEEETANTFFMGRRRLALSRIVVAFSSHSSLGSLETIKIISIVNAVL